MQFRGSAKGLPQDEFLCPRLFWNFIVAVHFIILS